MKVNIVGNKSLNSHINFLFRNMSISNRTPVLRKKHAYLIGSIRSLFVAGAITKSDYIFLMKMARSSFDVKYRDLMKVYYDSLDKE